MQSIIRIIDEINSDVGIPITIDLSQPNVLGYTAATRNIFIGTDRQVPVVEGDFYFEHPGSTIVHPSPIVTILNTFNVFVGPFRTRLPGAGPESVDLLTAGVCNISPLTLTFPPIHNVFIGI